MDNQLFTQIHSTLNEGPLRSKRWTRIIAEAQYTSPSTGDMVMFDLYCLYALWWNEGSGKEQYGHQPTAFGHSRSLLIDRTFEECLFITARRLLEASRKAAAEEIQNLFDPYLIDPKLVARWVKSNEWAAHPFSELDRLVNDDWGMDFPLEWWKRFGYSQTMQVFAAPFWRNDKSDLYGGSPWLRIVETIMSLDNQIRRGSLVGLMGAVDHLYDLDHNTGSLASKFDRTLRASHRALDQRAEFRSVQEFAPFVSAPVRRLIRQDQAPVS